MGTKQRDWRGELATDIRWPCTLPPQLRDDFIDMAEPLDLKRLNDGLPGIVYIRSGCLTGYTFSENMDASLGMLHGHGCWFGIQSIHALPTPGIYEAITPTELVLFPKEKVESWLNRHPEGYQLLFFIAQHIGRILVQTGSNTLLSLTSRIIYVLLELANKAAPPNDVESRIKITQQTLSHIVGISRPRLNEILHVLSEQGAIRTERGTIVIRDPAGLKARLHSFSFQYHDPLTA